MTHSSFWWMRTVTAVALLVLAGCKKSEEPSSADRVASLLFDVSSPEAREALATPVDFRVTEEKFAQWERAQGFLDAVPRSALASASGATGNRIDRAVATLEASPRARTAIERTGLSVRDFVLETIALAQAAEAETGKAPAGVNVPAENVQFIKRYRSRILQARASARAAQTPTDTYRDADTMSVDAQREAEVRMIDSASVREREGVSDSAPHHEPEGERPRLPPPDTVRDTTSERSASVFPARAQSSERRKMSMFRSKRFFASHVRSGRELGPALP